MSLMNSWWAAPQPLIIAHRGASADVPENSLAACHLAAEQGADAIELDVQLSADRRIVIFHDDTVARFTGKEQKVSQLTVAELKKVDLGHGQTIPTLDELLEMMGPRLLYDVELKDFSLRDKGLEAAVADRFESFGLADKLMVSSFNPFAVRRARKTLPRSVPVALIRKPGLLEYTYFLASEQADNPHYNMVDEKYMRWAKGRGYRTYVWTVDDPAEASRLAALGVHGVITNRPQLLRQHLS
jgi:glycerophosphoryl diester phosphodiesterase